MVPRGQGVILNMCSIAGMRGTGGFAQYNMTKGAVRMLTMALADELGPHGHSGQQRKPRHHAHA